MADNVAGIELAYNIVDALRRFGDHSDCQLFSALLAGQAHPAVWFDRVVLVEKLRVSISSLTSGRLKLPVAFLKIREYNVFDCLLTSVF